MLRQILQYQKPFTNRINALREVRRKNSYKASLCTLNKGVEVEIPPFKLWLMEKGPSLTANLTREEGLFALKQMIYIREMELEVQKLYQKKLIRGYCHLYNGQEAICTGCTKALGDEDRVITSYRCHAWLVCLGTSSCEIISELLQKQTGNSRGRGGSMHMFNKKFFGGNGIVGAQCPLGAGVALANKLQDKKCIILTIYGDGAANQGQLFESMNIAALLKLPIIYMCENNRFAMGTSTTRSSATKEYFRRVDFIPGIWVDGMNYLSMREVIKFATQYVLENGPIIIEAFTYRYMGHSVSDPGVSYRTREEIDDVREKHDCINNLANLLMKQHFMSEEERKEMTTEARKNIREVSTKAQKANMPAMEELAYNIYSQPLEETIRGSTPFYRFESQMDTKLPLKPISVMDKEVGCEVVV